MSKLQRYTIFWDNIREVLDPVEDDEGEWVQAVDASETYVEFLATAELRLKAILQQLTEQIKGAIQCLNENEHPK